jgi:hypothetical protein
LPARPLFAWEVLLGEGELPSNDFLMTAIGFSSILRFWNLLTTLMYVHEACQTPEPLAVFRK